MPALEDKIVQSAVAEVLSAIYEVDFLGFSYGFRPGRSPHMALDALHTAIMSQRVNWVLDADIRSFFDSVDHASGCCGWWRTGSLIVVSYGSLGCGCGL
ncbi:reverse transcriptase/maturase family protein, partial [Mesorhizobium sp. M1066]